MFKLDLDKISESGFNLLCLGAHCDDIEIGCGGTILKILQKYPDASVYWIVFSATKERAKEATESANLFLSQAKEKKIIIKNFQDGYFPYNGASIKDYFEQLKKEISPSLIFTHYRADLHQDHRLICELSWNTFRNHLVLEYEIPKYDGDLGSPNCFVHLEEQTCRQKIDLILKSYQTQNNKKWFTPDTFLSIMRLRGLESCAPEKFAESFYCRKSVVNI